jgi:Zn-dependent protease with chaperone function
VAIAILVLLAGMLVGAISEAVLLFGLFAGLSGPDHDREGQILLIIITLVVGLVSALGANVVVAFSADLMARRQSALRVSLAGHADQGWMGTSERPVMPVAASSLAGRAFIALALTVCFYLIAGTVAVLLLVGGITALAQGTVDRGSVFTLIGGLAIVWSILPRPRRFKAPGPRVDLTANPHLAEHLLDVARRVREPLPSDVYVSLDMNASVAQRGGWLGWSGRRYMVLGLPLMQLLSVSELRAVFAHEFGHFAGGDTALGAWVHRARMSIARTVVYTGAVSVILWLPFRAYAWLFFRITKALSRQQEYAADALAARTVGAVPMSAALRKLDWAAQPLIVYLRDVVLPVLRAGYAPPVAYGFADFMLRSGGPSNGSTERAATAKPDPYDSHPPTADRLGALAALPPGADPATEPAATALLSQLPMLEQSALTGLLKAGATLRPVTWEQVGPEVLLPVWRDRVLKDQAVLAGATLGNAVEWARSAEGIGHSIARRSKGVLSSAPARQAGITQLAMAIGVALVAQGWNLEALPSAPIACRRADHALWLFDMVERMANGQLDAGGWQQWRGALGIEDANLAQAEQPSSS